MATTMERLRRFVCLVLIQSFKWTVDLLLLCVPNLAKFLVSRQINKFDQVCINGDDKDGGKINLKIYDDRLYKIFFKDYAQAGLAAYVDGLWECDRLEDFLVAGIDYGIYNTFEAIPLQILSFLRYDMLNSQGEGQSWKTARKHYDYGNVHWRACLGPSMVYSCAYWKNAENLDQAQLHKMELIAKKLQLKPGMKVLDLGCGWGSLCKFLATNYQVEVVGVTNSVEGAAFSKKFCRGVVPPVRIEVADYRTVTETFDRIVSIELMEHIGPKNYTSFFNVIHRCLKKDGIFVLQAIITDNKDMPSFIPWVHANVVPNLYIPTFSQLTQAINHLFTVQSVENLGPDFYTTSIAWRNNFVQAWPTMQHLYPDPDKVYRTWYLYFSAMAAPFKARRYQLWHLVGSKVGGRGFENGCDTSLCQM